ncbi:hypothetical protein GOV10_04550 [Candidatus Woesearchaeota archaeon]|nr:hypothetical protein [Candidatus Woesearchaeota archaeon]
MDKKTKFILFLTPRIITALIGLVLLVFGIFDLIRSIIKGYELFGIIIIFLGSAILFPSLWSIYKKKKQDSTQESEKSESTEKEIKFVLMIQSGFAAFFMFFLMLKNNAHFGVFLFLIFLLILLPQIFKKAKIKWIPPASLIIVASAYIYHLWTTLPNSGLESIAIIIFMIFFGVVILVTIPSLIKRIQS